MAPTGLPTPPTGSTAGLFAHDRTFLHRIPQNGPNDTGGAVVVVDPRGDPTAIQVVNIFPPKGCAPNGTALGPGYEAYLGCTSGAKPGAQIIDIRSGQQIAKFSGRGLRRSQLQPG